LVEVRSALGSATERVYQDLIRHLQERPNLPGATPIDGGALVISHDLRMFPRELNPAPYTRPEFLAAQTEPVISALELFEARRDEDAGAIRDLLFGLNTPPVAETKKQGGVAVADLDRCTEPSPTALVQEALRSRDRSLCQLQQT